MRKKLTVVLAVAIFAFSATASYAATGEELVEGMGKKLVRGVINTFTGWVEFPAQIIKGYNEGFMGDEDNKILGTIAGIFDGIGHSAGRTLSGLTDLVGFWAANPESNEGVGFPLDAEYAWEEGTPYNYFDPNFKDAALVPAGNKILRGAGNTFFGFVELPGQIVKGVANGAPDLGIIKGLWYWASREVYGLSELMTSLLPTPTDELGVAFDEKWPWTALTENVK